MAKVSPFGDITEADYPGIFKDFDSDNIPNVDDPRPLISGDTETVEEVSLSSEIKKLIDIRKRYQDVLNEVMDRLQDMKPSATVKGRVKSPYSIINKLRRKRLKADILTAEAGEKYTKGLTDMAGCMIVLENQKQVNEVVKEIKAGKAGNVFEHEDFYNNPLNGYRAHHFIVTLDDIAVEIQVKTQRMKQIAEASHTPYKLGMLNGEYMEELTDLAWMADQGDTESQELFAEEMSKGDLQEMLTLRSNPDISDLQEDFRDSVKKLALIFALDKFPEGHKEKGLQLFREHGELIGVDFDAVFNSALEQAEKKSKITQSFQDREKEPSPETETEPGNTDLNLAAYEPIKMTTAERAKANDAALAILQKEDRAITAADIDTLRRYTGNGGLKDKAFGNQELEGKKRGSLNEHYTSYPVIQMIWDKLAAMGVQHGNILEPGSGIGNFAGFLPDRQNMRMLMVEQSVVSSRISKLLYPKQRVLNESFQTTDLSLYNITGVVGNVPFGDLRIATRKDPLADINPQIHDYFILKSLDALEPGGFLAVITSTGTMDKKTTKAREAMVERAGFVGAYRLPSTAFKDNADTVVTTDLVIFQKYKGNKDAYAENNRLFAYDDLSVATGQFGSDNETYEAYYNPYYDAHPEHVLGEHLQGHAVQWPTRMGVKGTVDDQTIQRVLNDGLSFAFDLPEKMSFYDVPDEGVRLETARDYHPGNIVHHQDEFYEKQRVFYKKISIGGSGKAGEGLRNRIASACKLLDLYDDYVTALAQDSQQKEPLRDDLKRALKSHIDSYGIPDEDEDIRQIFKYDNRLYKLTTFVKRDPVNEELVYADILDADSMFSDNYTPELSNSGDLSQVAMFLNSIGESLDVDTYLSTWKGGTASKDELLAALDEHSDFFYNPESENYEFRYEYLAGNVRKKLEVAESHDLKKNVDALKEVLPEWIDVFKIQVDPRHIFTYLPAEVLKAFIKDKFNYRSVELGLVKDKADVGNRFYMRLRKGGRYVSSGDESQADYNLGWGTVPFTKILNNYIQDRSFPWIPFNEEGNPLNITKKDLKERASRDPRYADVLEDANRKQGDHNEKMLIRVPKEFNKWLRTEADSVIRERVERAYNETYNSTVNPTFDGSTLRFRGMSDTFYGDSDFRVYKHNRAVAEKLVWNGRGGNFHDVGAGKTMASIITSQVLLQQGTASKCLFVVPGKVQEKWVEEYSQLFPDAKLLNMKMQAGERHKELTMAQLYNWDAIFIADHAFKRLSLSPDEQAKRFAERVAYFDDMLENFDEFVEEDEGMQNSAKKRLVKNLEKQKEEFETKLRNVTDADRLETDIFFDELGVDALFFDEAHFYKNAISSPKAQKLGIAATQTSQRAEDALQKSHWLLEKKGFKNVFVLTATPVVNSPIEVWHMLNLCAPDLLDKYEFHNLDNFINQHVKTEEKLVKKTTGKYKRELVVSGYINLPEMRKVIDEVTDIKSYDQLIQFYKDHPDFYTDENGQKKRLEPQFKRPKDNTQQQIVEPSRIHKLLFDDIILRANNVLECMKQRACETRDNFLVITGDGSKISTDLRVYDNDFEGVDRKYLKLGTLAENVKQAYETRTNPPAEYVPESIYGNFFTRHRQNKHRYPITVGKGMNDDGNGYWIVYDGDEKKYKIVADGDPLNKYEWQEGIFGTREEAEDRLEFHKNFDQSRDNPTRQTYRNQIIFCDWISLEDGRAGSFHELIKEKLIETGIPKKEIVIINGGIIGTNKDGSNYSVKSGDDKEELKKEVQDEFNSGKYRVLIGNKSIAEGMNLQKWTTDIHHMDVPYTPSEIQQRNGRGLRQGNQWGEVNIHFYLMQDSFDQYRLELVSKKQAWIDELFFGEGRQSETQDEASSLNYEQMVSATNSDPRVKQFFDAKAQASQLQGKIATLDEETQRLESSLARSQEDIDRKRKLLNSTIEREKALMDTTLPETPQEVLDRNLLRIDWTTWNNYNDIQSIENEISSEHKKIFSSRINIDLDVPTTNASGRVLFNLIPDTQQGQRQFYNRIKWSSIKQTAPKMLEDAFGWSMDNPTQSGRSLAGLKGNIIADEGDFYEHYDIDIQAERENDASYEEIKRKHGMFRMERWVPIVELKLAELFLILERAWINSAEHRQNRLQEELEQSEKTLRELESNMSKTKQELENARKSREQALETQSELTEVVNEVVAVEFQQRAELYEELNRIAPKFGINRTIQIRDIDANYEADDEDDEVRENPVDPLIYIGTTERVTIDTPDGEQGLEGEFPTFLSDDKIYIVPEYRVREVTGAVNDLEAIEGYEQWHNYEADETDIEIDWPVKEKARSVGTALKIWYASDKIIQEGDNGEVNHYVHDFDPGRRPAVVKGDILIIGNIDWDGRGILN